MRLLRGGACIAYGANSLKSPQQQQIALAANHDPSACNAVKYAMLSKSRARKRFMLKDYTLQDAELALCAKMSQVFLFFVFFNLFIYIFDWKKEINNQHFAVLLPVIIAKRKSEN